MQTAPGPPRASGHFTKANRALFRNCESFNTFNASSATNKNQGGDKHETVQKGFEPRLIGFTRFFPSHGAVTEIRLGAQRAGAPISVL